MVKLEFISRKDALYVWAKTAARAEIALSNYLGRSYGALEKNERANADTYVIKMRPSHYPSCEQLEILSRDSLIIDGEREIIYTVLETIPLDIKDASDYARLGGTKGGARSSKAKTAAARANGKKGGRPKIKPLVDPRDAPCLYCHKPTGNLDQYCSMRCKNQRDKIESEFENTVLAMIDAASRGEI